jgi:glycosyltransferase involved in cell wall biosynthesis
MRLLLAINDLHPREGGPPRVVIGSGTALAQAGHDVTILSIVAPGDEQAVNDHIRPARDAGVKFVFIDPVRPASIWFPPRRGRLAEAIEAADLLHCHGIWNPLFLTAAKIAEARAKPYFVSVHGLLSPWAMRKSRLKKRVAWALFDIGRYLENARGVIFGTRGEFEVSTPLGAQIRPLFVPNGVSSATGSQPITPQDLARLAAAAPPVAGWNRTVLFFSRIHPKKGLDMLIEAFASVAPRFPATGLLIAGLPEDPDYQRAIERQIAGVTGAEICMTTDLVGEEARFLYALSDVFVLPSHEEGFSMALLEALACGCPSLSTTLCHLPEIAEQGAGVVTDPNPESIARGLADLLRLDGEALAAMRSRARALFETRFTLESVARQLSACYSGEPAS